MIDFWSHVLAMSVINGISYEAYLQYDSNYNILNSKKVIHCKIFKKTHHAPQNDQSMPHRMTKIMIDFWSHVLAMSVINGISYEAYLQYDSNYNILNSKKVIHCKIFEKTHRAPQNDQSMPHRMTKFWLSFPEYDIITIKLTLGLLNRTSYKLLSLIHEPNSCVLTYC